MRPRLESVWFRGQSDQYPRLARVLEHTARRQCPWWFVRVREVDRCELRGRSGTAAADNSWKLEHWVRAVTAAPDGARVLLVDVDTFVTRNLDALWDVDFDVAYTVRAADCRLPLNGGVLAVRVGDLTRKFMEGWLAKDRQFLEDPDERQPWRKQYGGHNQASFGYMITSHFPEVLTLASLPCLEWNCEDSTWADFDPDVTRIVHVKSALRMAVFNISSPLKVRALARLWRMLEREAEDRWSPELGEGPS